MEDRSARSESKLRGESLVGRPDLASQNPRAWCAPKLPHLTGKTAIQEELGAAFSYKRTLSRMSSDQAFIFQLGKGCAHSLEPDPVLLGQFFGCRQLLADSIFPGTDVSLQDFCQLMV